MTMKANAFTIDSLMSDPNCCLGTANGGFVGFQGGGNASGMTSSARHVDTAGCRTDTEGWRQNTDVSTSPPGGGTEIKSMEGNVVIIVINKAFVQKTVSKLLHYNTI